MKVLITSDLFDSTINGVVTSVKNLEKELTKQGHEVRILTVSDQYASYQKDNVYYMKSVPAKIYPDIRIPVSKCADYIEELIRWKPDVVHSQCEFFSFGYAKKIVKATGAVFIHTYHTLYEQYTEYVPIGKTLSRAALGKWIKLRLRNVDTIIAPTKKVEYALLEYGMENNIQIIPSGIQIDRFFKKEEAEITKRLKEKYQIPEDKTVLLSLGRLGFEKRIDELLRGMKALLSKRQDVVLLIVGGGPARGRLEQLAKELGIERSVRFAGMVNPNEVADYYKLGDIFTCASTSETQGLTYIEAMASGLPLVCRKDPCLYGVLEEGGNGYSYESIQQFVSGVQRLLEEKEIFENARQHSRKIAEEYGTKRFGKRVESCYEKVLLERECEKNESAVICEESTGRLKKWSGESHGYARRIS